MRMLLLAAVLAVAGCAATPADLDTERASGVTVAYRVSPDDALRASDSLLREEFDSVSDGSGPRSIRAVQIHGLAKTFFGVWVEPCPEGSAVTALSLRLSPIQPFVFLTEDSFHSMLAERLASR